MVFKRPPLYGLERKKSEYVCLRILKNKRKNENTCKENIIFKILNYINGTKRYRYTYMVLPRLPQKEIKVYKNIKNISFFQVI